MITLAIDSSAKTASAAVMKDGIIISSNFVNAGLTHSETLLPLIKNTVDKCNIKISDIDCFSVCNGPGSFTGIRIGVATVKGLAFESNKMCCGVSTLEAIAYNFADCSNRIVCAVMDARRNQFYNALFKIENSKVIRLCEDRAIAFEDLRIELHGYSDSAITVAGDGADLFCSQLDDETYISKAEESRKLQSGEGAALCSIGKETCDSFSLMPVYLRPSQAERELKLKKADLCKN